MAEDIAATVTTKRTTSRYVSVCVVVMEQKSTNGDNDANKKKGTHEDGELKEEASR